MKIWKKISTGLLITVLVAGVASCSDDNGNQEGSSGGKSVPGLTADTITLGNLTDLTGTWGPVGKMYLSGVQLWVDAVNAGDGVCGRKVDLLVRDHKSNPQDAVNIYKEMEPSIFAMTGVLGTGPTLAVAPLFEADDMISSTYAWDEGILEASPNVFPPGSTYGVAVLNIFDWAREELGIKAGDTIGLIRYEGLFDGVKDAMDRFADEYDLKTIEQKVQFTDSDFTGPVTAFQRADAKWVIVAMSVAHTGGFVATAAASDYTPKMFSPSPGNFDESLLDGPAKEPLQSDFFFGSPYMAWDDPSPAAESVRDAFAAHGEGTPNYGIMLGYGQGEAFGKLISETCASGDLTRERLVETFRNTSRLSTDGIMADLDFTRGPGKSQSVETRIFQPDASVPTGLRQVVGPHQSPLIEKFGL